MSNKLHSQPTSSWSKNTLTNDNKNNHGLLTHSSKIKIDVNGD